MGVLDWLDFGDLATVATMGRRNYDIVHKHYLPKFKLTGKIVVVDISEVDERMTMHYYPSRKGLGCKLLCTGHRQVLSVLATFCPVFKQLRIMLEYKHQFDSDCTRTLANHLNTHCSSVQQFIQIPLIRKPTAHVSFDNVTSVHLMAPGYNKGIVLERNFPRMEHLRIDVHKKFALTAHFPNLREFEMTETYCNIFDWHTLAAQNPQIRSLNVDVCWPTEQLQQLNELFPHLESLHIRVKREISYDLARPSFATLFDTLLRRQPEVVPTRENIAPVRLQNVKSFTMDISGFYGFVLVASRHFDIDADRWAQDRLALIQFGQLDSYKYITSTEAFLDEQVSLILGNPDLVSVDISSLVLPFAYVQRLVDGLPKLKEITWMTDLAEPTNIVQLMEATSLETIIVAVGHVLKQAFFEMQSLPGQWTLDGLEQDSALPKIAFTRRPIEHI